MRIHFTSRHVFAAISLLLALIVAFILLAPYFWNQEDDDSQVLLMLYGIPTAALASLCFGVMSLAGRKRTHSALSTGMGLIGLLIGAVVAVLMLFLFVYAQNFRH